MRERAASLRTCRVRCCERAKEDGGGLADPTESLDGLDPADSSPLSSLSFAAASPARSTRRAMDQQHHQPSPARPLKRLEPDSAPSPPVGHDPLDPIASTSSAHLAHPHGLHHQHDGQGSTGPPSVKRKITRRRQVFSCRACTTRCAPRCFSSPLGQTDLAEVAALTLPPLLPPRRKIRCEREGGPGTPCKACEKRGESSSCDAGTAIASSSSSHPPGSSNGVGGALLGGGLGGSGGGGGSVTGGGLCTDSCAEHRDDLERRVQALEASLVHGGGGHGQRPRSSRSTASANGFRYSTSQPPYTAPTARLRPPQTRSHPSRARAARRRRLPSHRRHRRASRASARRSSSPRSRGGTAASSPTCTRRSRARPRWTGS